MPELQAIAPRPHGTRVRGSDLTRESSLYTGSFGRLFRSLPPADFGDTEEASERALAELGAAMLAPVDNLSDESDEEESGIPAAFTYLGQFIDHDLTFDPASSLQRHNDPSALVNFRTPRFDLDSVYGRGPDDQPYMYERGRTFLLGPQLTGAAANADARDLPRNGVAGAERALIGDPRNDENVIISQLQGLFHRFHNCVARDNPGWTFERVQRDVRFHYQWVVLHDFLPQIVSKGVLAEVMPLPDDGLARPRLTFYKFKNQPFIPLEFSAAAYRFGHSMVRPGYRLSENVGPLRLFTQNPNESLVGFRKFPAEWAIDWNLFIDVEQRPAEGKARMQLAYRIDTSLVNPLGHLPASIAPPPSQLAGRNLRRGWRLRLPAGQEVARAMGLQPLDDAKITVPSKQEDQPGIPIVDLDRRFADNTPLWVYVLAETVEEDVAVNTKPHARTVKTPRLGPVGGRIVAETILGLLAGDRHSFLSQDPRWRPRLATNDKFGLRELIAYALGKGS